MADERRRHLAVGTGLHHGHPGVVGHPWPVDDEAARVATLVNDTHTWHRAHRDNITVRHTGASACLVSLVIRFNDAT